MESTTRTFEIDVGGGWKEPLYVTTYGGSTSQSAWAGIRAVAKSGMHDCGLSGCDCGMHYDWILDVNYESGPDLDEHQCEGLIVHATEALYPLIGDGTQLVIDDFVGRLNRALEGHTEALKKEQARARKEQQAAQQWGERCEQSSTVAYPPGYVFPATWIAPDGVRRVVMDSATKVM